MYNDHAACSHVNANELIPTIGLFPGSRKAELEITIPLFAEVMKHFKKNYPEVTFSISQAPRISSQLLYDMFNKQGIPNELISLVPPDSYHDLVCSCCMALTGPGTTTLELAIHGTPHIIAYRVSWWIEKLLRWGASVNYVGLPNIFYDKEICPELLQEKCTTDNLITHAVTLYEQYKNKNPIYYSVQDALVSLKKHLIDPSYE